LSDEQQTKQEMPWDSWGLSSHLRIDSVQIARLGAMDLLHQKLASLVLIFALAAVLTPLLVLFGLKFGVIDGLAQELVQNPVNREIRLIGHGRFDEDWFQSMSQRKEIAFVVPRTRGAAASIDLRPAAGGTELVTAELIPSGSGDPLLAGYAPVPMDNNSIVISERVARALNAKVGDQLKGSVRRKLGGKWSRVHVSLKVIGLVPDHLFARNGGFVTPHLLTAIEDYRDGYATPELGWNEGKPFGAERFYSSFRLYVRELNDVATVRDLLMAQGQGYEVSTKAKAIEEVKLFDRYLTSTFLMIASIGVVGYLLSFGASMWVNVERKRRELSVLQLLGFRSSVIMFFPVVQSAIIALCGGILAMLLFGLISALINNYFAQEAGQFEGLCRLLPSHLFISLFATLICAIIAAGLAAYRTTRIEPSKGLREL
jgi:putative ABC transport system permease protein